MTFPGDPAVLLNPTSLRKVLNYSPQHRIVIGKALKKAFPSRWPDERSITEHAFYESLFSLLKDPETRNLVSSSLYSLIERKNKHNWKEVLTIRLRIIGCSFDVIQDRQLVRDILKQKGSGFDALFDQLDSDGHPEFRWWYRWAEIYLDCAVETEVSTPAEVPDSALDELLTQWRTLICELDLKAESARAVPSLELVQWLEEHVKPLKDLAHRYAKETDLSNILEQCRQTLDGLEVDAPQDLVELISKANEALGRYQGMPQPLEHWLECLQQQDQKALRAALSEEREHKEAIMAATNHDDYDEVSRRSTLAKAAHERYRFIVDALAGLVRALDELSSVSTTDPRVAEEPPTEKVIPLPPIPSPPEETGDLPDRVIDTTPEPPTEPANARASGDESAPFPVEATSVVTSDSPDVDEATPDSAQPPPVIPPVPKVETAKQPDGRVEDVSEYRAVTATSMHWDAQIQVSELADEVRKHEGMQRILGARALAWALVRDGDIQTAYHFSKAFAADVQPAPLDIRPEPLRAIHLGDSLTSSTGEEVDELSKTLRQFYDIGLIDDGLRAQRPMTLLLYSALLRPTLVAPDLTGARELLRALPLDGTLTALHELREMILARDFHYRGILHLTQGAELDDLRARASEWWQSNRYHTFNYPPANPVWRKLLEPEQGLGRALAIVTQGTDKALDEARSQLRELQNQTRIERMIQEADEHVRGRAARRNPIEARPVKDMVRRAAKIAELLEEWLSLHANALKSGPAVAREQALRTIKSRLLRAIDNAHTEVVLLGEEAADLPGRAAACCTGAVLSQVKGTLLGARAAHSELSTWWRRLNGVLLGLDHNFGHAFKPPPSAESPARLLGERGGVAAKAATGPARWPV